MEWHDGSILAVVVGSRMWGTATNDSDTDIREIVVPSLYDTLNPYVEPKPANQVEVSEYGQDFDITSYELRHFARLVTKGNPTFIETLFSPIVEHQTSIGRTLRAMKTDFVGTDEVYYAHRGFATGQLREAQKTKPSRPRGKLLSAGIIGCLQAVDLMRDGYVNPETLLSSVHTDAWAQPLFHVELKLDTDRHDEAEATLTTLIDRLDEIHPRVRKRRPNIRAISDFVYAAYCSTAV